MDYLRRIKQSIYCHIDLLEAGTQIRHDDPSALKDIILEIQTVVSHSPLREQ